MLTQSGEWQHVGRQRRDHLCILGFGFGLLVKPCGFGTKTSHTKRTHFETLEGQTGSLLELDIAVPQGFRVVDDSLGG